MAKRYEASTSDDSRYQPSCVSRTVDGLMRGGLVGLAWGFFFHPVHDLTINGWYNGDPWRFTSVDMVPRMKSMGKSSIMFGSFLAVFSGASCAAESLTQKRNWVNVFVGGSAAGVMLSMKTRDPRTIAISAVSTGLLTSVIFSLTQNQSDDF